jgi:hyperosmotically inducible protein
MMSARTLTITFGALLILSLCTTGFSQDSESNSHPESIGKRSSASESHDLRITQRVKTALAKDSQTNTTVIDVATKDGVVTLTGDIGSHEKAEHAQELVAGIKGVKSVDNELRTR